MVSGMGDNKVLMADHRLAMTEAGFLRPLCPQMAEFLKIYKSRKARYAALDDKEISQPDGRPWSIRRARVAEMKRMCKEAIAGLRGESLA